MKPQPVFVIAPQRTGTTMLQNTLAKDPNFDAFGEIFHDDQIQIDRPTNFFHFLLERKDLCLLKIIPTPENTTTVFKYYLSYLQDQTTKPFFFVDIKQNSIHHFNLVWNHRFAEPNILTLIKKHGFPIIRIKRRNIFLQVLSETYAFSIGKYHFEPGEQPPVMKINLDVRDFEFRMAQFADDNQFIDGHLTSYSNKITFHYEDLTDNGQLKNSVYTSVEKFLNVNIEQQTTYYTKSVKSPDSLVANATEVIEHFRNTKYEQQVISALKPNQ